LKCVSFKTVSAVIAHLVVVLGVIVLPVGVYVALNYGPFHFISVLWLILLTLNKGVSLFELEVAVHCCLLVKLSALFLLVLLLSVFKSFFRVCIDVLTVHIVLLAYLRHWNALKVVLLQVLTWALNVLKITDLISWFWMNELLRIFRKLLTEFVVLLKLSIEWIEQICVDIIFKREMRFLCPWSVSCMPRVIIFLAVFDYYIVNIIKRLIFISAVDVLIFRNLILILIILFILDLKITLIIFSKLNKYQFLLFVLTDPHTLLDFDPLFQSSLYWSINSNFLRNLL
jgi:hypothetical protein